MHFSRSHRGRSPLTGAGAIPTPSEATLLRLASIAAQVEELLAPDNPLVKAPIGINTVKNDRRRSMEAILLLLADRELRGYLEELDRLGLLPPTRRG
jgi:hypothetical protein